MGNRRFRLTNIIPKLWLSNRSSATPKSPKTQISRPRRPQSVASKSVQSISMEASSIKSFDEMLLLSSSSRSFSTDRVLPQKTEHALPPPIVTEPRRASVYKSSSNSDESPRRRKFHSKCCHGMRLKVKSPRINAINNARRSTSTSTGTGTGTSTCTSTSVSSSSCSSSFGSDKRGKLCESSVTVVKSSANPERDFKESMVEMIVENKINDVEGLEELLVSYLVLNSDEFHNVIVCVFKEIVTALYTKQKKLVD